MKRVVRVLVLLAVVAAPAIMPSEASAQRRAVARPVPRSAVHVSARPYYYNYYRPYYRPYYYYGPSLGFGFYGGYAGWYGWYGSPFFYGAYGAYPYPYAYPYAYPHYYDSSGAARIQVQPRHAEVFIDGYFVGTVDDFDGWAQRLHIAPGEHELAVYLKGHHTLRQNLLFRPGATLRIEHVMQPLAAGDVEEPRPTPSSRAARPVMRNDYPRDEDPPDAAAQDPSRRPGDPVPSPRRVVPVPSRAGEAGTYGSLSLRVQPFDAEVIVNGEAWQSPEAGSITLQLSEGSHRVEVRKNGYRSYTAEVRVRRGDTTSVNVSLSRE